MKKLFPKVFLLLILQISAQCVFGQKTGELLIDSLQTALTKSKQDTNRVNILNELSLQAGLNIGNYDTARYFSSNALTLAKRLNFKKGSAVAYKNLGIGYYLQSNYQEAMNHYSASLKISKSIGDRAGEANVYNNISLVFLNQANYPEALKNLFLSLKIRESIGDKSGIATCYSNIGLIYFNQKNFPDAIKNQLISLKINKELGKKDALAKNYDNLGNVYDLQGNPRLALENHFASLKLKEELDDKFGIAVTYINIGQVYDSQKNYTESLKNYFEALNIQETIGDKYGIANSYLNIGTVYLRIKRIAEGKKWLNKGLNLSREIGANDWLEYAYENLADADSAMGDYRSALKNYKLFTAYKDSLFNRENTKKLTQTAMQYEFDKKQLADSLNNVQARHLAAEKLEKQKTYTGMGAGLTVLLLGFSFFIFRNSKKISNEKQKSEKLLLNILPSEVADELKEKGNAEARQFDNVSVLFTDFVNFTKTAENLTPKQLVQELNECFTAFDNIMDRNGLEKIKTVGDAYLAVCGLPVFDSRHPQKAVQAALEIRDFMINRSRQEKTFEIRIGIHSGSVVAGIVGIKKFAYDIWGDTVNTAARMEQSGEAGKVNISEITHQLVKDDFNCVYRGEIEAKNKGKMGMYFVES